jgi:hypothetical protein
VPAAASSLPALRRLLSERFPSAVRPSAAVLPTGIPAVDQLTGGLPQHALTELVCAAPSCGGQIFVGQLLAATRATRIRVALVDSTDAFDPHSYPADQLAHLIWVRCQNSTQALQSTDLLARDANLGLVMLDLRRAPVAELRRIPNRQWYLLQRAVESTDLALLVLTPHALVASAQLRLVLEHPHPPTAFETERPALVASLAPALQRQRVSPRSAVA